MKRVAGVLILMILLLAGGGLLCYPLFEDMVYRFENNAEISRFRNETAQGNGASGENAGDAGEDTAADDASADSAYLLQTMESYNERIYREGQAGMTDAWSDVDASFDFGFTGLEDEMIGYITIPAMDEELPLYIGADQENLSKGAAVLAQTSMPVGGENTNCVIAAHRGYGGKAMFREIEKLVPGDRVEITNLWETLTYEVVKCIVIDPSDIEAVQIIPGADMVTLVTCHPYTQNYQRYVVYCRREQAEQDSGDEKSGGNDADDLLIPYEGVEYEPSGDEIRREQLINYAGIALFAGVCAVLAAALMKKIFSKGGKDGEKRKNRQRKKRRKRRKHRDGIKKS